MQYDGRRRCSPHPTNAIKENYVTSKGITDIMKAKNGKNKMCSDFTDLNKTCLKDSFPLPHIDSIVDSMAGHEMVSDRCSLYTYSAPFS